MNNNCNSGSKSFGRIIGALFLLVATGLTFLTHSDYGILGMFFAGAVLCVKPRSRCQPCCGYGSSCCCSTVVGQVSSTDLSCDMVQPKKTAKPAAKPRKAKKPV